MKKILINTEFGGYDFSNKAVLEYLIRKGTTGITFHSISRDKITDELVYPEISKEQYLVQDLEDIKSYVYGAHIRINGIEFNPHTIRRTDPIAIQMVEDLGSEFCDTYHSHLVVEEFDETLDCIICEYDGCEKIRQEAPPSGRSPCICYTLLSENDWCEL